MGAAPAGAGAEFCASAGSATRPNSAVAIVTAIRLFILLLPAPRASTMIFTAQIHATIVALQDFSPLSIGRLSRRTYSRKYLRCFQRFRTRKQIQVT
jgi:hypothetical protein